MPYEERMMIDERSKYLRMRPKVYLAVRRKERTRLLGEMEQVTGLRRKILLRHMNSRTAGKVMFVWD